MSDLVFKWSNILIIAPFFLLLCCGCGKKDTSSALSPEESLKQVEEGFDIKLRASEPLVQTPVAMQFDARGRPLGS